MREPHVFEKPSVCPFPAREFKRDSKNEALVRRHKRGFLWTTVLFHSFSCCFSCFTATGPHRGLVHSTHHRAVGRSTTQSPCGRPPRDLGGGGSPGIFCFVLVAPYFLPTPFVFFHLSPFLLIQKYTCVKLWKNSVYVPPPFVRSPPPCSAFLSSCFVVFSDDKGFSSKIQCAKDDDWDAGDKTRAWPLPAAAHSSASFGSSSPLPPPIKRAGGKREGRERQGRAARPRRRIPIQPSGLLALLEGGGEPVEALVEPVAARGAAGLMMLR